MTMTNPILAAQPLKAPLTILGSKLYGRCSYNPLIRHLASKSAAEVLTAYELNRLNCDYLNPAFNALAPQAPDGHNLLDQMHLTVRPLIGVVVQTAFPIELRYYAGAAAYALYQAANVNAACFLSKLPHFPDAGQQRAIGNALSQAADIGALLRWAGSELRFSVAERTLAVLDAALSALPLVNAPKGDHLPVPFITPGFVGIGAHGAARAADEFQDIPVVRDRAQQLFATWTDWLDRYALWNDGSFVYDVPVDDKGVPDYTYQGNLTKQVGVGNTEVWTIEPLLRRHAIDGVGQGVLNKFADLMASQKPEIREAITITYATIVTRDFT
uniref:Uncharacterized protein n=1 Tax=viral metagenome TaxID=1070528 RepID=A0A2V0RM44_9ZZZZ